MLKINLFLISSMFNLTEKRLIKITFICSTQQKNLVNTISEVLNTFLARRIALTINYFILVEVSFHESIKV